VEAIEAARSAPWEGPRWQVAVACGTLKGGRADWLVEKCTELGAGSFIPILTERSPEVTEGRSNRLDRVALAAAKQCLRTHALEVVQPTPLSVLLNEVRDAPLALLAAAGAPDLPAMMQQHPQDILQGGMIIIGPEGDFTPEELNEIIEAGAVPVGLGPLRLRAETAAIAMLATLMLHGNVSHSNA